MSEALTLISNRICPFAHRAWLTLLEKQVLFTFKEASLSEKEAWFTEAYHRAYAHDPASDGKVPVLIHNDQVLTQSDLISWYVAESFNTSTQLIPQKPFDRLRMRRAIQEAPGKVISAFYSTRNYHKRPEAEQQAVRAKIEENLKAVEALIEGPYVLGETFSLADILLYPWYERWFINQTYFGIAIPAELSKTHAFIAAMQSRPSVKRTLAETNKEFFLQGYLSYLKPFMNAPRVMGIDEYEGQLLFRSVVGNLFLYLTEGELCLLRVGGPNRKESIRLKGRNFLGFAVSERGYVALLDRRSVEIRRVDALGELLHRFGNIAVASQGCPRLRWDEDQLYLIYPDRLEILDVSTRSRRGYTDIVVDYESEQLADLVIANLMDSERAVILQLKHRLVFSIIPTPVCDIDTPLVNAVLTVHSPLQVNDSRREYVIVLLCNKQLRVYNLLSLQQICEVQLCPKSGQTVKIQADPGGESLLVRYSSPSNDARNVLYRVNSKYYQAGHDYYSEAAPFFCYKLEVSIAEDLALFPTTVQECGGQLFDCFHFVFFKNGHVYSASQLAPHNFSQNPSELGLSRGAGSQMSEWKQLIAAYMRLSNTEIPRDQRHLLFPQQQRKAYQYEAIKADFDNIVARFTERIHQQSKKGTVSEQSIQQQWNLYLAQVAKQRKFTLQTMSLFKIESQVVKNESPQQLGVSKELESCVRDLEEREGRIDARIKERKREIEGEKRQREKDKDKDKEKEKEKEKQNDKRKGVTSEQLQRYQQDYQKFVAEFMQQSQKKEREERKSQPQKGIVLALPALTQEERKIIESANHESEADNPPEQSNDCKEWLQMQQILNNVDEKIRGAAEKMQPLVSRLSRLQMQGLERIKRNEEIVRARCSASLQEIVKNSCKRMLSGLSGKVKKEMETATREIYRLQDRNKAYYEESIERFKDFVKMQLYHRIDLYHRGRARLQQRVLEIAADQH